jgi:RNA polymerase sigma-70 factor, ECF subfamily
VYAEHAAFTWRALRHLGLPPLAVDDAVQELWVVVYRRLTEFEGRSQLKSWLFGIAVNVARNHRRSLRRRALDPEAMAPPEVGSAGAHEEQREALELVQAYLATLDDERREIFVCNLLEGMSAAETASATGVSLATVQNRVRALRRAFKTWIIRQRSSP